MTSNWRVGDLIYNRWEVHAIRQGGMGIVYIVWDSKLREAQAAKTFLGRGPGDQAAKRLFEREALNWLNLDLHTNVVGARVLEHINSIPFLFLEYVAGDDLRKRIQSQKLAQAPDQLLTFALAICDGMSHAVAKGIRAHCDLKPENCLITHDDVLKVSDFGLAISRIECADAPVHQHGGTLPYMAPERFEPGWSPDIRADVYSFGVMLFEMLTGQFPFSATTPEQWVHCHRRLIAPRLGSRFGPLGDIVDACLEKEPRQRPPSFLDIRRAVATVFEGFTGRPPAEASREAIPAAVLANNKGVGLMELGKFDDALECFKQALIASPKHSNAWNNLGNLQLRCDQHEAALASYDRAIALNPNGDLAWSNKALVLKKLGRLDEAVACYEQALMLDPSNPQTCCNLGCAFLAKSQLPDALAYFDRALDLDPRLHAAWFTKGAALSVTGKPELGLSCLEEALRLNPNDAETLCEIGWTLGRLGRHGEEVEAHSAALEIDDAMANAWFGKATGLVMLGRLQEALECYDRSLHLNPSNLRARTSRVRLIRSRGRFNYAA